MPDDGVGGSRIIPAYAGSTATSEHSASGYADHPRIRGEHWLDFAQAFWDAGSSPHTRGARRRRRSPSSPAGIIPAYAGSTWTAASSSSMPRDHPRIRGEHKETPMYIEIDYGSSPHTRGARRWRFGRIRISGIIPAYAGSTQRWRLRRIRSQDHPRIRGEHRRPRRVRRDISGSSPHTRGALVADAGGEAGGGGSSPRVCIGILMRSSTWRSIFLCRGETFTGG